MASMREIKRRRSSIQSTQQITKAMKLVSTVKLQRARQRAEDSKAYFEYMYRTINSILAKTEQQANDSDRVGIVVITSNRGLAGGYNANIARMIQSSDFEKEKVSLYIVGQKGADMLSRKGYRIVSDHSEMMDAPSYEAAKVLGEELLAAYKAGEIGKLYVAYTEFKNTVTHIPKLMQLLPIEPEEEEEDSLSLMNFEPNEEEVLGLLIPKYVTGMLYGALLEATASENGARMQAMDSATNNAEEIISDLELKYNRARQSAITQELTEIIAGADAIG